MVANSSSISFVNIISALDNADRLRRQLSPHQLTFLLTSVVFQLPLLLHAG